MKLRWQTLSRRAINCSPAIMPVLATVAVSLTVVYYAVELGNGQPPPTWWDKYLSWSRHIPEWLTKGLLMFLCAGSLAFFAYRTALKYRIGTNAATAAGVATTAVLAWAVQSCDLTGAITAGLSIAGVGMAGAVGIRTLEERGLRKALEGWWSNSVSEQTSIGTV